MRCHCLRLNWCHNVCVGVLFVFQNYPVVVVVVVQGIFLKYSSAYFLSCLPISNVNSVKFPGAEVR